MKLFYKMIFSTLLTLFSAMGLIADDCIYLVGNMTGWYNPGTENEAHYQNYRLLPNPERGNGQLYQGVFDINLSEAPMFRFYTDLTGWDGGDSMGSQVEDYPITYYCDDLEKGIDLVWGKGNIQIDDWAGDKMYISFWMPTKSVYVSPTDFIIPQEALRPEMSVSGPMWNYNDGVYYTNISPGVIGWIRVPGVKSDLVNEDYAYIKPAGPLKLDEYGIAVQDFTYVNDPYEFIYAETKDPGDYNQMGSVVFFVDLNKKKIYCNQWQGCWITGSFNDNIEITFDNYKDYDQYFINNNAEDTFKIFLPKSQITVSATTPVPGKRKSYNEFCEDWNIESSHCSNFRYYIDGGVVKNCDWPGGTLIAKNYNFGYIESFDKIYINNDDDQSPVTELTNKGGGIFETVMAVPPTVKNLYYQLKYTDKLIPAPGVAPADANIIFKNGVTEFSTKAYLDLNNYGYFCPLQLTNNGGHVKIVYNQNDDKITFTLVDGKLDNIPVIHILNSDNEELSSYPIIGKNSKYVYSTGFSANNIYERSSYISFTDGRYLIPDFYGAKPDKAGVITGKFSLSDKKDGSDLGLLRGADDVLANVRLFSVDTENNIIRMLTYSDELTNYNLSYYREFYAPKFFYVTGYEYATDNNFPLGGVTLENYKDQQFLNLQSFDDESHTAKYYGHFELPEDINGPFALSIGSMPGTLNYTAPYYGFVVENYMNSDDGLIRFDTLFPAETPVVELPRAYYNNYMPNWIEINPEGASRDYYITITISEDFGTIRIGNGEAEIIEIPFTVSTFNAIGETGSILVETVEPTIVNVFNFNGSLIRRMEAGIGQTRLDGIAPGFYIVNGKKITVK